MVWRYISSICICWYQVQGHLQRSRSNIKFTFLKKWAFRGHSCFTNTFCLLSFQFKLQLSHDGSGKGAALVAAVAMRLRDLKKEGLLVLWPIGGKKNKGLCKSSFASKRYCVCYRSLFLHSLNTSIISRKWYFPLIQDTDHSRYLSSRYQRSGYPTLKYWRRKIRKFKIMNLTYWRSWVQV